MMVYIWRLGIAGVLLRFSLLITTCSHITRLPHTDVKGKNGAVEEETKTQVQMAYGKLPLYFIMWHWGEVLQEDTLLFSLFTRRIVISLS